MLSVATGDTIVSPKPAIRLPLLRVCKRRLRTGLVAFYDTHVLIGGWSGRRSIAERMCAPEGEPELASALRRARRMEFADVAKVKVTTASGVRRFRLEAGSGQTIRFHLPDAQAGRVEQFLRERFADRYWANRRRASGCLTGFLLLLALLCVAAGVLSAVDERRVIVGLVVAAPGLLFLLPAAWLMKGSRYRQLPADEVAVAPPAPPPRPVTTRARLPLRSRPLGWLLKAAGLGWWILVASPLADPLADWMMRHLRSGQAQQMVWLLVWAPAPLLIFAGYQLCQRGYAPAQTEDPRRPVLYLRPFGDDRSTSLQPGGMVATWSGIRSGGATGLAREASASGRISPTELAINCHPIRLARLLADRGSDTSEESLTRFFESYGPVIAIGRPGERLATPGAARMYVDDASWQQSVLHEMRRAQAVVMQPAPTEGVRWELEQIRAHVEPFRVIVCLVSYWRNPQAYEDLLDVAADELRVDLPRAVPYLPRPAFVYFDREWRPHLQELSYKNPILWPLTGDAADLTYSLHPFVQGMHGGEREPARPARWAGGASARAARAAAAVVALVVTILPVMAVYLGAQYIPVPTAWQRSDAAALVARSAKVSLHGRAVAYEIQVPEALAAHDPTHPLMEHVRKSDDDRFQMRIFAHAGREDVAQLIPRQWEGNSMPDSVETQVDPPRQIEHAGAQWHEGQIATRFKNGTVARQIVRGTSSSRGTVVITILHITGPGGRDEAYLQVADDVLQSFQFVGSASP